MKQMFSVNDSWAVKISMEIAHKQLIKQFLLQGIHK
jgi:hypothetical protein